jgi:hypothetical protein
MLAPHALAAALALVVTLLVPSAVAAQAEAAARAGAAQAVVQAAAGTDAAMQGSSTVEITATDYAFRAPDAIPSGWTTIRFTNEGSEPHFVFMSRLPEGKTVHDYETELSPAFARSWEAVRDRNATVDEALQSLFEELPPWFPELNMVGGPGLAAPGRTTETTMQLQPGNYVIECYAKTADGKIHYMEGMIRPLTVEAQRSSASQPAADVTVTLSNNRMEMDGELASGRRTIAVHVAENPEEGFGHSAHLARLDADANVDDVVAWMNWFAAGGLAAPAPAEFIGGVHFMPVGETAYFTVDLVPGRYLLVSEATAHLGVLKEFTVR